MTPPSIDRRKDLLVAEALGWRCGIWHGAWNEDCAGKLTTLTVRDGLGWLTPSGRLSGLLPPFSTSRDYVPVLLDWLKPRADVVVRPRPDGYRIQAWWLDDTGRENGAGVEIDAPTMPQAVAETVIAYQEHLREWATMPHGDDEDDEDDDG